MQRECVSLSALRDKTRERITINIPERHTSFADFPCKFESWMEDH